MGGRSTQEQTQTATTAPWQPAVGSLQGILAGVNSVSPQLTGVEQGALAQLTALGQKGNQFAPQIGGVANTLLSGGGPDRTGLVNDAYQQYAKRLNPIADGQFNDPTTNPVLQKYLEVARNDASNNIRSQFAGAGRDLSGMENQNVARGITQAEAPILYDAYNQSLNRQMEAANNLYGAGGSTAGLLSGLDQTRLANQQAGISAADAANQAEQYGPMLQFQAEAQRRGIPLETLAAQMGITLPAAQAFGARTGTGSGSNQMARAQRFALLGQGVRGLFGQGNPSGGGVLPFGTP